MRLVFGSLSVFGAVFFGGAISTSTAHAQLWKQFVPTPRAAAPRQTDHTLTQSSGPWIIVAASFSGDGAEKQSRELAEELTSHYRLKTYVHEMSFDFSKEAPGRGVDEYGAPIRRRFQRGEKVQELAVLIGDFSTIDDPEAQKTLDRIKVLKPNALNVKEGEHTSQSMAQVHEWQDQLLEKLGKKRDRGPMATAFLTRNPLLPREYFVPKGVDDFVVKMNRGVKYSLLDCPGRYTVRIATFRGATMLQTAADDGKQKSSWGRKGKDRNPLMEAAENAHLVTEELRAHGIEAYEFHDRTESIVAVGSFNEAMGNTADGRTIATPQVQKILQTFGAEYDTPADPINQIGNDQNTQRLVQQKEQQFNMNFNNQNGQIVPGLHPKHVKIFKGSSRSKNVERVIPLDPYPQAMEAPKRSVSSAYAGG